MFSFLYHRPYSEISRSGLIPLSGAQVPPTGMNGGIGCDPSLTIFLSLCLLFGGMQSWDVVCQGRAGALWPTARKRECE